MNIEKKPTKQMLAEQILEKCDFLGDHARGVKKFIVHRLRELEYIKKKNIALQQTIEKLKCCGNCHVDDICFIENSNHGTVCECWKLKENI